MPTADDVETKASAPASAMLSQWIRIVIGIIAAAIAVYQLTRGHGLEAAFSFAIAATFLVGTVHERAVIRARRNGVVIPRQLLISSISLGVAIGGTLFLGALLVLRAL